MDFFIFFHPLRLSLWVILLLASSNVKIWASHLDLFSKIFLHLLFWDLPCSDPAICLSGLFRIHSPFAFTSAMLLATASLISQVLKYDPPTWIYFPITFLHLLILDLHWPDPTIFFCGLKFQIKIWPSHLDLFSIIFLHLLFWDLFWPDPGIYLCGLLRLL